MIKKNNYTVSFNTGFLCDEFIRSLKFRDLLKQDLNVDNVITFIVKEFITTFTSNVQSKDVELTIQMIKNRPHFIKCMRLIISFFSFFYKDSESEFLNSKLSRVIGMYQYTKIEHLICLWCFFSVKDYLSLDERLIYIPEYTDGDGILIPSQTYEDMLKQFNKNVYHSWGCNKHIHGQYRLFPIMLDDKYITNEIDKKIKEYKTGVTFIVDLWDYKEFSYFVVKDNPREGKITHLRFL